MRFSRRRALAAAVFAPLAAKLPNSKDAAATPTPHVDLGWWWEPPPLRKLNAARIGEERFAVPLTDYDAYKSSFRVTVVDVDNGTITLTYDDA